MPRASKTVTLTEMSDLDNTALLQRIHNFLGDEDIHRNYDFLPHMLRIEEYLNQLFLEHIGPRATKPADFPVALWEQATLMVKTHKEWIAKDREVKPFDFDVIKALMEERSQILTSDIIPPPSEVTVIPAPVSPTNPAIPKEVKLCLPLGRDDPGRKKILADDPMAYTKKAVQHRQLKEYAVTHTEDTSIISHIPAPSANFHGPFIKPVTEEQMEEATQARIARLVQLHTKLQKAQETAPRPLLAKVLARIDQGSHKKDFDSGLMTHDLVEDFNQWANSSEAVKPLTKDEWNLLSILTEPSWSSNRTTGRLDKHPESRFHISEIPNLGIERTVIYNGYGETGSQITMDKWAVFQRLGYRLGVEGTRLTNHRLPVDEEIWAREKAQEDTLKDLMENRFDDLSLNAIVKPLLGSKHNVENLNDVQKVAILRSQIILESLRAEESRILDHSKLWSFAASKPKPPKPFFSVSRWPTDILSPDMRLDMAADATVRDLKEEELLLTPEEQATLQRDMNRQYFAPPPRERFIRGEPYYPFGETKIQERVLSRGIMADLIGVDGYDFSNINPQSTNLSILGQLNPLNWLRKRKAGPTDDGNPASGTQRRVESDSDDEIEDYE